MYYNSFCNYGFPGFGFGYSDFLLNSPIFFSQPYLNTPLGFGYSNFLLNSPFFSQPFLNPPLGFYPF